MTLEAGFYIEALRQTLRLGQPQIFNTDQGTQFTSRGFTAIPEQTGVAISMDGQGRVFDNIFVERLWRSVRYEELHLKDYGLVDEARWGLGDDFAFYNSEHLHQSPGSRTPAEVYFGGQAALGRPRPGMPVGASGANVTM